MINQDDRRQPPSSHDHLQSDLERLARLRPIDDDFMRCLFRGQLPLAQEVLRILTGIDDLILDCEETQRDLRNLAGARSVCLDVWGRDTQGRIYNLEVQRSDKGASPRRARYHSAALDMDELKTGDSFGSLPETYVIFVTEQDVFAEGAGVYCFERRERESGRALDDGTHVLFANARYNGSGRLGALMHDFLCADPDDMTTPALAERVRFLKKDDEGVKDMCKIFDEIREEGVREGLEEGREEGRAEGRVRTLFELVGKGLLARDAAARELSMSPEEFSRQAAAAGYKLA